VSEYKKSSKKGHGNGMCMYEKCVPVKKCICLCSFVCVCVCVCVCACRNSLCVRVYVGVKSIKSEVKSE
jgi:hypothetical protein